MPTKSTGPTALIAHTSSALLTLGSLDLLPEMSAVLAARDELSRQLDAVESELLQVSAAVYVSFCKNSSPENPSMFEVPLAQAKAKIETLEANQAQLRAQTPGLDEAVALRRRQVRAETLPAIRDVALPAIEQRIAHLEAIAMVNRLLVGKKSQARNARQRQEVEELTYLRQLRDVLTAADPS